MAESAPNGYGPSVERHDADVVVVGAGPAGLLAAIAACEAGRSVLVVDENPAAGGQIWREATGQGPHPRARLVIRRVRRLGAGVLSGVTVFDGSADARVLRALHVDDPRRVLEIRYRELVLATGASELFLPFPGWTLPGVTGVGGLQALVKGGFAVRGRRVLLAGSGPLLLAVAASLKAAGARVVGLCEQAPRSRVRRFGFGLWRHPLKALQGVGLLAALRGVPIHHDSWVVEARGAGRVERAFVADAAGNRRAIDCDLLATGYGLVPASRLAELLGCAVDHDGRVLVDETCATSVDGIWCAGEPTGIGGVEVAMAEGRVAGSHAAGDRQRGALHARLLRKEQRFVRRLERAFALRDELRALPDDDTILCRCEDVSFGAVRSLRDARQAKLETRCGMGPCQGRVCGPASSFLCGFPRDRVRPPLIPVPMGALAVAGPSNTSKQRSNERSNETMETPE